MSDRNKTLKRMEGLLKALLVPSTYLGFEAPYIWSTFRNILYRVYAKSQRCVQGGCITSQTRPNHCAKLLVHWHLSPEID